MCGSVVRAEEVDSPIGAGLLRGWSIDADSARVCLSQVPDTPRCVAHEGGMPVVLAAVDGAPPRWILVSAEGQVWLGDDQVAEQLDVPGVRGPIRAAALSSGGEVIVVDQRAVHIRRDEVWRHVESRVSDNDGLTAVLTTPGGRVFVGGDGGRIWELRRERLDEVAYGGVDPVVRTGAVVALWWSSSSQALYARTSSGYVVELQPREGKARAYEVPTSVRADLTDGTLWGLERVSGPSVLTSYGEEVYELRSDGPRLLGRAEAKVRGLRHDVARDRIEAFTERGWVGLTVPTRAATSSPPLNEQTRTRVERAESRRPPPRWVTEGRLVPEIGLRLGGLSRVGSGPRSGIFAGELGAGVWLSPWRPSGAQHGLWVWPRVGYALRSSRSAIRHGGFGDVGLGYGGTLWSVVAHGGVGWMPGISQVWSGRASVGAYFLWSAIGVELRAEELTPAGQPAVGAMLQINLAPWVWIGTLLSDD